MMEIHVSSTNFSIKCTILSLRNTKNEKETESILDTGLPAMLLTKVVGTGPIDLKRARTIRVQYVVITLCTVH